MTSLVTAWRGPLRENTHRVHAAVVTPDGALVATSGDPELPIVLRSTAKPFQAQPFVASGAMARFGLGPEELALACASHDGRPEHVGRVRRWLDRIGLTPSALGCGPHAPLADDAARDLCRSGAEPEPIHNNCSGKHAAMLSVCVAEGLDVASYLEPTHPLQRRIRDVVVELSGVEPRLGGTDGCSAPTFGVPLSALARLYARLADPRAAPELSACFDAMRAHAELVAGPGTVCTELARTYDHLVGKRGADGCYAIAVRHSTRGPLGVALSVEDGSDAARDCAAWTICAALGLEATDPDATARHSRPSRRNCNGRVVGHLEAHLDLRWRDA